MKPFVISLLVTVAVSGISLSEPETDGDITGIYASKEPALEEIMEIMYAKGHFNFLHIGAKDEILELKGGNRFIRTINACKTGPVSDTGKWKKSGKTIILDFDTPEYEDQSFTIYKKNRLYMVANMDIGQNETMPHLTLLEKQ